MPRRLIVNADDFGIDVAVNEAVEQAHRKGILTSASLMVGAPAAADAVARARRLPRLAVGLHLCVVDAIPVSPAGSVAALLGTDGRLRSDLFRAGLAYRCSREARGALRREIEAQFSAFAATGLRLDHANTHRHMHLHPEVARLMLEIGRAHGLAAVRVPREPVDPLCRAEPGSASRLAAWLVGPWVRSLRRRVARAGLRANDYLFGMAWSGKMHETRVGKLLPRLPHGLSEIYFHPTTTGDDDVAAHRSADELRTLTSPAIRRTIEAAGIELTSFGALDGQGPSITTVRPTAGGENGTNASSVR